MRTRKFAKALEVAEKLLLPLFLFALRPISDQDDGARIKRMRFRRILADALATETTLIFKLSHIFYRLTMIGLQIVIKSYTYPSVLSNISSATYETLAGLQVADYRS